MSDSSDGRRSVAGYNQFAKLIRRGKAVKVYLAKDADPVFAMKVRNNVRSSKGVVLDVNFSAAQLAEKAGVDVPTAIVTEII